MADPVTRLHIVRVAPLERPRVLTAIRRAGRELEGRGEDVVGGKVRNNRGAGVDELRRIAGVGRVGGAGSWCAVGASATIRLGFEACGLVVPFELDAGARRLALNAAEFGAYVIPRQRWTRWGSYRGPVFEADMRAALLALWHRGREQTWRRHVEVIDAYDAATDTLWTWAANVAPRGDDRLRLLELGIVCHPGQAVYHRRTHAAGSWRRRLDCVVAL